MEESFLLQGIDAQAMQRVEEGQQYQVEDAPEDKKNRTADHSDRRPQILAGHCQGKIEIEHSLRNELYSAATLLESADWSDTPQSLVSNKKNNSPNLPYYSSNQIKSILITLNQNQI